MTTGFSSSGETTCGIQMDGTLWCWGANMTGAVGNNTMIDQYEPVQIAKGPWTAVTNGASHACALAADSTISCWGNNDSGQLGLGDTAQRLAPTPLTTKLGWTAVTAGDDFTCALASDATAWCWGDGYSGELGDGKQMTEYAPSQVDGELWTALSAGTSHACGVRQDGHLRCWGDNTSGELGNGESYSTSSPTALDEDDADWAAVASGAAFTCATKLDGSGLCWGDNTNGQLGNTTMSRFNSTPAIVVHGARAWTQLSTGRDHTCGVGADNNLWCFGLSELGTSADVHAPVQVPGTWKVVSAGLGSTCAIDDTDALACWGENADGQLGDSTIARRTSPKTIAAPSWTAITVGPQSACALAKDGALFCWGSAGWGLGDGSYGRLMPTAIPGGPWSAVATDSDHTCAVLSASQELYCWGGNGFGELGTGDYLNYPTPHSISTAKWDAVATSGTHTCAISAAQAMCWGSNDTHQVDSTANPYVQLPSAVMSGSIVTAGNRHTCAIDASGIASCWGDNTSGQLGIGDPTPIAPQPTPVAGSSHWLSLALGVTHTCGIATDHSLWCWGDDARGQLGDDASLAQGAPVRVGAGTDWMQVTAGATHTCALQTGGALWCWGDNTSGQLGLGTSNEGTPVLVP
jgi:alpha-tubulin suppressor-like RCC1 family protein